MFTSTFQLIFHYSLPNITQYNNKPSKLHTNFQNEIKIILREHWKKNKTIIKSRWPRSTTSSAFLVMEMKHKSFKWNRQIRVSHYWLYEELWHKQKEFVRSDVACVKRKTIWYLDHYKRLETTIFPHQINMINQGNKKSHKILWRTVW